MAEGFCDFHDMPLNSCPHSLPQDRRGGRHPQFLDLEADGPTIEATQHGDCAADCGRRIHPGDLITHTPEGWAHVAEVDGGDTRVSAGSARTGTDSQPGLFDGL